MADISSLYPQAPKPVNPLEQLQGFANLQGTVNQNKMQQQELRGRAALGRAIEASRNEEGVPNQNKLMSLVSQDPDASWMALKIQSDARNANPQTTYMGSKGGQPTQMVAPESTVRGLGSEGQRYLQGDNRLMGGRPPQGDAYQSGDQDNTPQPPSQETIDEAHAHLDTLDSKVGGLMNDPALDNKKVLRTTSDLVADPTAKFSAVDGASVLSTLPYNNGKPLTPDELREHIRPIHETIQAHKAALNEHFPSSRQLAERQPPHEAQPVQLQGEQDTPGVAVGVPAGYTENQGNRQKHYLEVQNEANAVPQENAVLNNILNISKAGGETGTMVGSIYQSLASTGLAPPGITDKAEQLNIIKNHAAQMATAAGMPGSDARLEALESSKITDKDLPGVIQSMIPYLVAVNNSKILKAQYYQKVAPNGANPQQVEKAQQTWNAAFDPRLLEMDMLQDDPEQFAKFKKHLSKQDRVELTRKMKLAHEAGILE